MEFIMSKRNNVEVKLDFEVDVLTAGFAADLVNAIIEYLLFQRNQIPLVFSTFKSLISGWQTEDSEENSDYFIEKQRNLARATLSGINDVTMALRQEFKKVAISSIRLLFGSTITTPREAYIIKLPKISKTHIPDNHRKPTEPLIRKLLMSLVTSQDLYKVFSLHLPPTNMFVDIEVEDSLPDEREHFFQKEYMGLPPKCMCVIIDVHHKTNGNVSLNCCHEIEIFQDMANIRISDEKQIKKEEKEPGFSWLEANCFVRGFKDVPIKGKFIWQSEQTVPR